MFAAFDHWTDGRALATPGTNAGSKPLPFQKWRHFKEAFAPEIVRQAVEAVPGGVRRCLDPFGGSGTAPLACQFMGIEPTVVEVNPYLADLIEAKLERYSLDAIARDIGVVFRAADATDIMSRMEVLPPTFIEPGVNGRWVFDEEAGRRILQLSLAIDGLPDHSHSRLFRALLGGVLVDLSNVLINGKGRRYRRGWQSRRKGRWDVDEALAAAVASAIEEIGRYGSRPQHAYDIRRGSCLEQINASDSFDLAIFSPPYPNSFDYTDVYNVELWMLGYLTSSESNIALRTQTFSSHVQVKRKFQPPPNGSSSLDEVILRLQAVKAELWNPHLPAMVGGYFADMAVLMKALQGCVRARGQVWMVVGDSRYAGIHIPVGLILGQLAEAAGYGVERIEPLRQMRISAQQGGQHGLEETLVVLSS